MLVHAVKEKWCVIVWRSGWTGDGLAEFAFMINWHGRFIVRTKPCAAFRIWSITDTYSTDSRLQALSQRLSCSDTSLPSEERDNQNVQKITSPMHNRKNANGIHFRYNDWLITEALLAKRLRNVVESDSGNGKDVEIFVEMSWINVLKTKRKCLLAILL